MPLGLVRLRTFGSVHGLLRCNINIGVHAHVRRVDVSLRYVTIGYRVRMTSGARRISGIWRKLVEMRPASGEDGWLSLARGDLCGGCHTCWGGGRWKSQNRKIVPLSLCRRTFKLKGNKKVRTWTKKLLRVFRISRFLCSLYKNIICPFRIFMYMAMVRTIDSYLWVK